MLRSEDKIYSVVANASPHPSSLYPHAVQANGWLYVTCQLPTDPDALSAPLAEDIETQAAFCFANLSRILAHAGYGYKDAVFVRIYLSDFDRDFAAFKTVYARHFAQDSGRISARTTVGVARLGRAALVEIDLVCYLQL